MKNDNSNSNNKHNAKQKAIVKISAWKSIENFCAILSKTTTTTLTSIRKTLIKK